MSYSIQDRVWDEGPKDRSEFLVMLAMAAHANAEAICFPSVERLATMTRQTPRGVSKIIERLIAGGYVTKIKGGGRGHSNRYRLSFPEPQTLNPETVKEERGSGFTVNTESHDTKGGTGFRGTCQEPIHHHHHQQSDPAGEDQKDEGQREPDRPKATVHQLRPGEKTFRERLIEAVANPAHPSYFRHLNQLGSQADMAWPQVWLGWGFTEDEIVDRVRIEAEAYRRRKPNGKPISTFKFFENRFEEAYDERQQAIAAATSRPALPALPPQPDRRGRTPQADRPKGEADTAAGALARLKAKGLA